MARSGLRHRAGALIAGVCVATALGVPATAVGAATSTTASTIAPAAVSWAGTIAVGRSEIASLMTSTGASSMTVAFVSGSAIPWRETFGRVNAAGTKPTATTMYGAGSVSKMLATAAVMQLVDARKVRLDEPVVRYITDFRMADPAYREITVRMLLNHTAGLPGADYSNLSTLSPYAGYAAQVLAGLRTARLKTTPGSMAVYCNDCFTLAEVLVARVSGVSFERFVTDHLFTPLGMANSRYPSAKFAPGTYAPLLASNSTAEPQEIFNGFGTGGLYTTPTDMAHFSAMLMNGGVYGGVQVLSASSVAAMGADQIAGTLLPSIVNGLVYGLGWDTVEQRGLTTVGQTGWMKGGDTIAYHAAQVLAPDANLGVVLQAAGTGVDSGRLESVAERVLQQALVDKGLLAALPAKVSPTALAGVTPSAARIAGIAGVYASSDAATRVAFSGSTLNYAVLVNGVWTAAGTYTFRTDGRFWNAAGTQGLSVVTAWGRRYLAIRVMGGWGTRWDDFVIGQRMASIGTVSATWTARLGKDWLMVGERPGSIWWTSPVIGLRAIPGLGGFIAGTSVVSVLDAGTSDARAVSPVVVPIAKGRDLQDVVVVPRSGQEWLQVGTLLLRPKASVAELNGGVYQVPIEVGTTTSWIRLGLAGTTVGVNGAAGWYLYDSAMQLVRSGTGSATGINHGAGAYLAVVGSAGSVIAVDVLGTPGSTAPAAPEPSRPLAPMAMPVLGLGRLPI